MKLRSKKEYETEEPVKKFNKIAPKKVKSSSVKQHQAKIKDIKHQDNPVRTAEVHKFALKLKQVKNVRSEWNRIVHNPGQQERENNLKFQRAKIRGRERTMNECLKPVESLSLDGNVSENWRIFKRNWDIFMVAKGLDDKTDPIKINTFLNAIGKEAVEVFDSFNLAPAQQATYDLVVKAFDDFCKPRKNVVYERYVFGSRNQKEGEPFDTFLMEIKRLARNCSFTDENDMIRDRIVIGTTDSKLRAQLLAEKELTMDKAIEKARASEASKEQSASMSKSAAVNEIGSSSNSNTKYTHQTKNTATYRARGNQGNNKYKSAHNQNSSQNQQQRQRNTQSNGNSSSNNKSNRQSDSVNNCTRCGLNHKVRECPAYGKKCHGCSKLNHYKSMCKQRIVAAIDTHTDDDDDSSEYFVGTLNNINETSSESSDSITFPWIEPIGMNGKIVESKIDTGAETDVIPLKVLKKIGPIEVRPTSVTLRAFGGQKIKPTGMCTLLLTFNGISFKKNFAVVDLDFIPIIGLRTSIRLSIVQPSRVYKNKQNKRKHL